MEIINQASIWIGKDEDLLFRPTTNKAYEVDGIALLPIVTATGKRGILKDFQLSTSNQAQLLKKVPEDLETLEKKNLWIQAEKNNNGEIVVFDLIQKPIVIDEEPEVEEWDLTEIDDPDVKDRSEIGANEEEQSKSVSNQSNSKGS